MTTEKNWDRETCEKVLKRAMYIRLSKSVSMYAALSEAQEELNIPFKKSPSALNQISKYANFKAVVNKVRQEMPEKFAPLFESFGAIKKLESVPVKPRADSAIDREPLKVRRKAGNREVIYWTTGEAAKVAAGLSSLLSDNISRRYRGRAWRFVDYVSEAQAVLPLERRKSFSGLQGLDKRGDLKKIIDKGLTDQWILGNEETPTSPPEVETAPVAPAVPVAPPAHVDPLAAALSASIQAHARNVVLVEIVPGLVASIREVVREEIRAALGALSGSLGSEVHRLIEAELGPLHTPPAAPPTPSGEDSPGPPKLGVVTASYAEDPPRKRALVVDVVGLLPGQAEIVRGKINGRADLRFIESDHATSANFRENLVCVTKFINHTTESRARRFGSKLVRVNGGPHSVVRAVESLLQAHG